MAECHRPRTKLEPLSSLPDELLHHILSFLELSDVIATSFISRRWRYLRTTAPSLTVDASITPFAAIQNALILFNAPFLQSFFISFDQSHHQRLSTWIRFAVARSVRCLDLNATHHYSPGERLPKVHSSLYASESLEFLKIRFFDLNLYPTIAVHLPALKTLRIERSNLSESEILRLLAGCPNLEDLFLVYCNNDADLRFDGSNHRKLKNLTIVDSKEVFHAYIPTRVEVVAPYLLSLRIEGFLRRNFYYLKNLRSLVSVVFDLKGVFKLLESCEELMELLASVSHVRSLKLCSWCIQVLSLQEVRNEAPLLSFSTTRLELDAGLVKWDLLGMAYLLKSFLDIEELVVNFDEQLIFYELHNLHAAAVTANHIFSQNLNKFDGNRFWKLLDLALSCQFKRLRSIKIHGFMGSKRVSPEERENMEIEKFVDRRKNEIELVKLLLNNCDMLETMVINTKKVYNSSDVFRWKSEQLLNLQLYLSMRLLLLRRASPSAEIIFT